MKRKPFGHEEVEAGYKTPCHRPHNAAGDSLRLDRNGYSITPGRGPSVRAHRVRWLAAGNHATQGHVLDHLCRNRWCCNPSHLEEVTAAENVRRGDCTKLDDGEVALLRVLYKEGGFTQKALGEEFGLSQSHVSRLTRGLYWSDGPCAHWQQRKGGTGHL